MTEMREITPETFTELAAELSAGWKVQGWRIVSLGGVGPQREKMQVVITLERKR